MTGKAHWDTIFGFAVKGDCRSIRNDLVLAIVNAIRFGHWRRDNVSRGIAKHTWEELLGAVTSQTVLVGWTKAELAVLMALLTILSCIVVKVIVIASAVVESALFI